MCSCLQRVREHKTALPDLVIDSLSVLKYENYMLCHLEDICAIKLPFHHVVSPGREKFMSEVDRDSLKNMYVALYAYEKVSHVPLCYTQFCQIQAFEQTYTSVRLNL